MFNFRHVNGFINLISKKNCNALRHLNSSTLINIAHEYTTIHTTDTTCEKQIEKVAKTLKTDLALYENFITKNEHDSLVKEIDRSFRRVKYEYDHWDGAICGFRETEKSRWDADNQLVIERIRDSVIKTGTLNPRTHVLDLAKDGHILPHVDSVKFCGSIIAGLNLMSSAVMRFVPTEDNTITIDLLLPVYSLYSMKDNLRFDYTHEVLAKDVSFWSGKPVPRDRRVSLLIRNDPT